MRFSFTIRQMIAICLFSWIECDDIFRCVTKKLSIKANPSKKMDLLLLIATELKKAIT